MLLGMETWDELMEVRQSRIAFLLLAKIEMGYGASEFLVLWWEDTQTSLEFESDLDVEKRNVLDPFDSFDIAIRYHAISKQINE